VTFGWAWDAVESIRSAAWALADLLLTAVGFWCSCGDI
jgi:hypothetical protein